MTPANDEFELSSDDIKKRAAWAWYRTGTLCALAAVSHGECTSDYKASSGPDNR